MKTHWGHWPRRLTICVDQDARRPQCSGFATGTPWSTYFWLAAGPALLAGITALPSALPGIKSQPGCVLTRDVRSMRSTLLLAVFSTNARRDQLVLGHQPQQGHGE